MYFLSSVDASFECSLTCASFGIPKEVRKSVRGHEVGLSRKERWSTVVVRKAREQEGLN